MSTQPEALRLADLLETNIWAGKCGAAERGQAAAELRRLHQFAEEQIGRATAAEAALQMTKATHAPKIAALERQRDALLEALRWIAAEFRAHGLQHWPEAVKAHAAIAAVEGEKT